MTIRSNKVFTRLSLGSLLLSSLTCANPLIFSEENTLHTNSTVAAETTQLINGLRSEGHKLEEALIKGAAAETLAAKLQKENIILKWKTLTSKAQLKVMKQQAEELKVAATESTWNKFKNWFKGIDGTKVLSAIISGIVTIVVAIISII